MQTRMNRANDARKLKLDAAEAAARGKHKKALEKYLELERLEPKDGGWARRAGEMYRQLGRVDEGIAAFQRSADKYEVSGLIPKASAVCQTILRMRPDNADASARLERLMPSTSPRHVTPRPQSVSDLSREENLRGGGPAPGRGRAGSEIPAGQRAERAVRASGSVPPPLPIPGAGASSAPQPRPESEEPNVEELDELDAELIEDVQDDPGTGGAGAELELGVLVEDAPAAKSAAPVEIEAEVADDPLELMAEAAGEPLAPAGEPVEIEAEVADDPLDLGDDLAGIEFDDEPATAPAAGGVDREAIVREVLASSPLFAPFPADEAAALAEKFEVVEIDEGEILVEEGRLADRLLLLARGEMIAAGPQGDERLPAGAVLGSTSLLSRAPERVTARAVTSCVALAMASGVFREVIMTHPMLLAQLAES